MGFFRKQVSASRSTARGKPDSLAAVMKVIEAIAHGNEAAFNAARSEFLGLAILDIIGGLGEFARLVGPRLSEEHLRILRKEFRQADGGSAVADAVSKLGEAVMIRNNGTEAAEVMKTIIPKPPPGGLENVIFELVWAVGRACGQMDISFEWGPA